MSIDSIDNKNRILLIQGVNTRPLEWSDILFANENMNKQSKLDTGLQILERMTNNDNITNEIDILDKVLYSRVILGWLSEIMSSITDITSLNGYIEIDDRRRVITIDEIESDEFNWGEYNSLIYVKNRTLALESGRRCLIEMFKSTNMTQKRLREVELSDLVKCAYRPILWLNNIREEVEEILKIKGISIEKDDKNKKKI